MAKRARKAARTKLLPQAVKVKGLSIEDKLNMILVTVFFLLVSLTLFTWAFTTAAIAGTGGSMLSILNLFGALSIVMIALYYVTRFLKRG